MKKKKLLAVAVVGALASPFAFAQNVTIYGGVDVGVQRASNYAPGEINKNFVTSGGWYTSRVGLKGSKNVGTGLTGLFVIEAGLSADTGTQELASAGDVNTNSAGAFWNRQAYGGLESKQWGALTIGRQYTHMFHAYEVGTGTVLSLAGTLTPAAVHSLRAANSVKYSSPRFAGFTFGALWSPGEDTKGEPTTTNPKDGQYWDANVIWKQGPFGVAFAHSNIKTQAAGLTSDQKRNQITGRWDSGAFGIMGGYATNKAPAVIAGAANDFTNLWIQPVFRFGGNNELYGLWARQKDKLAAASNTTWYGVSMRHLLSKETWVYAGYGKAKNDNAVFRAPTTFAAAATGVNGQNPTGIQVGVATTF